MIEAQAVQGLATVGNGSSSIGRYNPIDSEGVEGPLRRCLSENGMAFLLPGRHQFVQPLQGAFSGARIMGTPLTTILPATSGTIGCMSLSGNDIVIEQLNVESTSPVDNQVGIRLTGDTCLVSRVWVRSLGDATTLWTGIQSGDGANGFQPRGFTLDKCRYTSLQACDHVTPFHINAAVGYQIHGLFVDKEDGESSGGCKYLVNLDRSQKGTITGCVINNTGVAAAPATALFYADLASEGHHFTFTGNFIETCYATEGILSLKGARFFTITSNVFGRNQILGGNIQITTSTTGGTTASDYGGVIGMNDFHNCAVANADQTTTSNCISLINAQHTDVVENHFSLCTSRQIYCAPSAKNTKIIGNTMMIDPASTPTISDGIKFAKSSNDGYTARLNNFYNNGGTWTARIVYGGAYTANTTLDGSTDSNLTI